MVCKTKGIVVEKLEIYLWRQMATFCEKMASLIKIMMGIYMQLDRELLKESDRWELGAEFLEILSTLLLEPKLGCVWRTLCGVALMSFAIGKLAP